MKKPKAVIAGSVRKHQKRQEEVIPRVRHKREALPPGIDLLRLPVYVPSRDNHYGRILSL